MPRIQFARIALLAAAALFSAVSSPSFAQTVESWVITIDSSTAQPVATGLVAMDADDDVIVLAEGAISTIVDLNRFDQGWFGPTGQTRLSRSGQPVGNGMPYGALIGGFTSDETQFEQVGRIGAFAVVPADVGEEFHVALNMSDADLLTLDGSVTVTLIYVPEGSADVAEITINSSSPDLVPTGLIADTGDKFIVLPFGAVQTTVVPGNPYSNGWFGTAGRPQLTRAGQPLADGPFGALYGKYQPLGGHFYIGDGGCWSTQPSDVGNELNLLINMSAADRAGLQGRYVANVIRVAEVTASADEDNDAIEYGLSSSPNPMRAESTIRFQLPQSGLARIRIADANGRWVRTLVDETAVAGEHAVHWDGTNDRGDSVPSGLYFYQLSTELGSRTGRMVIAE